MSVAILVLALINLVLLIREHLQIKKLEKKIKSNLYREAVHSRHWEGYFREEKGRVR